MARAWVMLVTRPMSRAFGAAWVIAAATSMLACSAAGSMDAPSDAEGDAADAASDARTTRDADAEATPIDARDSSSSETFDATSDAPPSTTSDPCYHYPGKEAWNCGADGKTLTRTISGKAETTSCANGCVSMPFGFDDQCRLRADAVPNTVNGHTLTSEQSSWIHYVAFCAVPRLQGARDTRLQDAARVAWWSLKEGILGVGTSPNPVGFSLCTESSGDVRIGPLETCGATAAWQVGASGVQVTCCGLSELESMATKLHPGMTSDEVLRGTATEAGYGGTSTADAIVASKDYLRTSWLLHDTAIGFTYQAPIVTGECITGDKSWCHGTGWTESADYAPDKPSLLKSIADIQATLDVLAP